MCTCGSNLYFITSEFVCKKCMSEDNLLPNVQGLSVSTCCICVYVYMCY